MLNDDLVREAMRFSRVRSKTALVEEALRVYVELRSSEERIKTYEKRLLNVQQALAGKRFRESSLDVLRADREHS